MALYACSARGTAACDALKLGQSLSVRAVPAAAAADSCPAVQDRLNKADAFFCGFLTKRGRQGRFFAKNVAEVFILCDKQYIIEASWLLCWGPPALPAVF